MALPMSVRHVLLGVFQTTLAPQTVPYACQALIEASAAGLIVMYVIGENIAIISELRTVKRVVSRTSPTVLVRLVLFAPPLLLLLWVQLVVLVVRFGVLLRARVSCVV